MTNQRICAKCRSPQEPIIIMGVEIDRCVNCGGIWLGAGEIQELIAKRSAAGSDEQIETTIDRVATARLPGGAPPPAIDVFTTPCTVCAGKLTLATFGEFTIEQCNACDGLFIGRGELAKAMEWVASSEASTIMAIASSVTTSGSIG